MSKRSTQIYRLYLLFAFSSLSPMCISEYVLCFMENHKWQFIVVSFCAGMLSWVSQTRWPFGNFFFDLVFSSKMTTTLYLGDVTINLECTKGIHLHFALIYAIQNKQFSLCKHLHRNWFIKAHDVIKANPKQKKGMRA